MTNKENWVEIGSGQEAYALKGEITEIEGIGGIVKLKKPMVVVKRINWNKPIYNFEGHDLFCKHLVAKILEELFLKEGQYSHEHIPFPLGSFMNAKEAGYYYKYVEGSEGFPFETMNDNFQKEMVQIEEWNSFVGSFNSFGFSVENDIAEANNAGIGKNVIMSKWDMNEVYKSGKLHPYWKRIDFGSTSCPFDYRRFEEEMKSAELPIRMGQNYNLASSAARYCYLHENLPKVEFEKLVLQFRRNC